MSKSFSAVAFVSLFLSSACALTQLQRENEESQRRIDEKEQALQAQEAQRSALLSQQKRLLADLESKQMTLSEISAKLVDLQRENDQIKADTAAQRKTQERLDSQLRQYKADIAALEKNNSLPNVEKQKRIEELKKQISAQLKLMLAL